MDGRDHASRLIGALLKAEEIAGELSVAEPGEKTDDLYFAIYNTLADARALKADMEANHETQ